MTLSPYEIACFNTSCAPQRRVSRVAQHSHPYTMTKAQMILVREFSASEGIEPLHWPALRGGRQDDLVSRSPRTENLPTWAGPHNGRGITKNNTYRYIYGRTQ